MSILEKWSGLLGGLVAVALLVVIWQLLGEEENLEARDSRGRTPLIVAAEEGNADRVRDLLNRGARIDAGDDCNWTAMMRAAARGHTDILGYLYRLWHELVRLHYLVDKADTVGVLSAQRFGGVQEIGQFAKG